MAETDDERRAREWQEIHWYQDRYEREDGPVSGRAVRSFTGTKSIARAVAPRLLRVVARRPSVDVPSPDGDA